MREKEILQNGNVFPASAGVILKAVDSARKEVSFPRIRGGDPALIVAEETKMRFSPHPRG